MIGRYMDVMAPKLHATAEKVLARLFAERGNLVRRTLGTRVGTNSPTGEKRGISGWTAERSVGLCFGWSVVLCACAAD